MKDRRKVTINWKLNIKVPILSIKAIDKVNQMFAMKDKRKRKKILQEDTQKSIIYKQSVMRNEKEEENHFECYFYVIIFLCFTLSTSYSIRLFLLLFLDYYCTLYSQIILILQMTFISSVKYHVNEKKHFYYPEESYKKSN